ncbi:bifunctional DedA family/phosphatase PAP2 family protein [Salinicola halimionae]|uniref:bifunctional DedA family/phosphatase PAP2 family protein n=1 Tax=Salinicola halimionae TaxID=1949081 RepID=UPI00315AA572
MGSHYPSRIARIWPLSRYPQWLNQAESLFKRHGGKSVFAARFVQGPRAFVPLVAGMSRMPANRFYAVNIASALIWAPSHVLAGIFLGTSLQILAQIGGRLAVLAGLIAALAWAIPWISRRILTPYGQQALSKAQKGLARWARSPRTPAGRYLARMAHSASGMQTLTIVALLTMLGCLWVFAGLLEDLVTKEPLVQANQAIFHALQALRSQWGDSVMLVITEMGDGFVTTTLTLTIAAWLLSRRAWRSTCYWLLALGGAALFTPGIKAWVQWPRPTANLYSGWELFSFPSGHATINAVLYGFLAYLIARDLSASLRSWVIGAACLWVSMIAFSRLYLGAHWFADVVAGMAIGTAWAILVAIFHQRHETKRVEAKGLAAVLLITLTIALPYHVFRQLDLDRKRYTPETADQSISWQQWWHGSAPGIPTNRVDLAGEVEEPLGLQWAGRLDALGRALSRQGWHVDTPWTFENTLAWLTPEAGETFLPVLPRLDDGHPPSLSASLALQGSSTQRLVIRMWPTSFRLTNVGKSTDVPLWNGSLRLQTRRTVLEWISWEQDEKAPTSMQKMLFKTLQNNATAKLKRLNDNEASDIIVGHAVPNRATTTPSRQNPVSQALPTLIREPD